MWSSVKLIAMLAVSLRACKLEQVKIKLLYLLISRFSRSYASWRGWDPERCAYLLRKPSQTGIFFFKKCLMCYKDGGPATPEVEAGEC